MNYQFWARIPGNKTRYTVNWYHDSESIFGEPDPDGYDLIALCDDCYHENDRAGVGWASADDGTTDRCHCCGREQEVIR
jgi:hypothetical protein